MHNSNYLLQKRLFDFLFSLAALILSSPFIVVGLLAVYLYDREHPIYFATRVGKAEQNFKMHKIRTMTVDADKNKVDSTSANDPRITPVGKILRAAKLDELMQFVDVLLGNMSLVGPRPNVKRETDIYTELEKQLLSVKPGITDFSSIVFSDLAEILSDVEDANIAYNQLVRPWKSRLGLFYIEHRNLRLDLFLVFATFISIINRKFALRLVAHKLEDLGAEQELVAIARREEDLEPAAPPGQQHIVTTRL